MISIKVDLTKDEATAPLQELVDKLTIREPMHAELAAGMESWLKTDVAPAVVAENHRTAEELGATPTGHLEAAFAAIESRGEEDAAVLLVPGNGRLAAAFGPVTIVPGAGKKALTIPLIAEAYGRRAGEFDDLFIPRGHNVLARKALDGSVEAVYLLVPKVTVPEDPELLHFSEMEEMAVGLIENFFQTSTPELT